MILYKYTKEKYLLSFKEKGEVLINTLNNLRKQFEPAGDEKEGKTQVLVGSEKEGMVLSVEELHNIAPVIEVPKGYKENKGNIQIVFDKGAIIDSTEYVPDAFVFCTSLHPNKEILRQFNYDTYYKIINPEKFADILFEKLIEKFSIIGFQLGAVKYLDKKLVLDTYKKAVSFKQDPNKFWNVCFTKSPNFSYQTEFRMVFAPSTAKQLEPQIIQSFDLVKCCSFS
jgi:hypothetical protein